MASLCRFLIAIITVFLCAVGAAFVRAPADVNVTNACHRSRGRQSFLFHIIFDDDDYDDGEMFVRCGCWE